MLVMVWDGKLPELRVCRTVLALVAYPITTCTFLITEVQYLSRSRGRLSHVPESGQPPFPIWQSRCGADFMFNVLFYTSTIMVSLVLPLPIFAKTDYTRMQSGRTTRGIIFHNVSE
jgi:hypothetical protein